MYRSKFAVYESPLGIINIYKVIMSTLLRITFLKEPAISKDTNILRCAINEILKSSWNVELGVKKKNDVNEVSIRCHVILKVASNLGPVYRLAYF